MNNLLSRLLAFRSRFQQLVLAGLILDFGLVASAQAATVTVTTPVDVVDGNVSSVAALQATPGGAGISLREAVLAINNDAGGPHIISIPAGTYTLTIAGLDDTAAAGDLDVKKAVTITGAGSASTIVRGGTTAANGVDKIFSLNPLGNLPGFPVSISGVTLRFGRNTDANFAGGNSIGGAMDFDSGFGANFNGLGTLTLNDVIFDQNSTTNGDGGGLALFDGGTVNVTNCQFTANRANSNATRAIAGGAIFAGFANGHAINYSFTSCLISGNATAGTVPSNGGGVFSFTGGLSFHACTIVNNSTGGASTDGGGIDSQGPLTIDQGTIVSGNTAARWGGGIFVNGTTAAISNSTITNNTSGSNGGLGGGGIFTNAGTTTVSNCRIVGNSATGITASGGSQLGTNSGNPGATMNAINNWFGTNAPPASFFGVGVTANPNLVLAVSASPTTINAGATSTLTATITRNSNAQTGFTVPDVTPISFAGVLGTMSPTSSTMTSGARTSTFTAGGTGGNGSASATVDSQTLSASITINQPPAITSANSTTFVVGSAGSFTVTANGVPAPALSVSGTLPSGVTFTPGTGALAGTPASGTGGSYPLVFTATSTAGSAMQNFTLTVNQTPAITSANNTTFTAGSAGTFTVTATGFPSPTLSVSGTLPSGLSFTPATGVLSGTPAANTGGSYPLTFTANNGVGSGATQNFTLTVNQAPAITSATSTAFVVGTAGTFTVAATGAPTPTLTQTGTLPSGVTFTPASGVLSGTPAAGTGGTYPLTFAASNGVGSAAVQNFTLTVNQAPAITSATSTSFTAGSAGAFNVIATGFPSPTIALTNGALASGVSYGNGSLAGTPAANAFGTYPLTFTASNGVGSNAVQNFSLVINPTAQDVKSKPAITANPGGGFRVGFLGNPGQQYTVQFTPELQPANWQFLSLQTAGADGAFFIIDNPPAGTTRRFYRALLP